MRASPDRQRSHTSTPVHTLLPWIFAIICLAAAGGWWLLIPAQPPAPVAAANIVTALSSGVVARMDSPVFDYSDGWRVTPLGADPAEPENAWNEPAGRVAFAYSGRELALQLAVGDYWGYVFVTVDGASANQLTIIPGNVNSAGQAAGYKPLLAPELQTDGGAATVWVPVHSATDDGPHQVSIEVWRSWGQTPLRGVAVDALPPAPLPVWPAAAFGLAAIWGATVGLRNGMRGGRIGRIKTDWNRVGEFPKFLSAPIRVLFWPIAILLIGVGVWADSWLITDVGLGLLALAGLLRPELWGAALLFGLPFYLYPLPVLPGRELNLVEIGVWGGLLLLGIRWIVLPRKGAAVRRCGAAQFPIPNSPLLFLLIALALISALSADYSGLALREWRTVFLAAGGFALLLGGTFAQSADGERSRRVLINGWLAGGTAVALIALWQFATGEMIIQAEGVARVRGLYGSPNNLALYLERTLAVGIGYWGMGGLGIGRLSGTAQSPIPSPQSLLLFLLLPQLAALVLTFSKGALFLGIPAMLLTLAVGGVLILARQGKSLRFLWWLVGIGVGVALGLLPFLGAERFRLLLDFSAGTTGGLRLNLWHSAWAMALDHPWLGVGPDNFLYAYRSGYILPAAWQDPNLNHPHNFVLDWWTRLGLPGLLLAAFWLGDGVRRLWRQLRSGEDTGLALGCLAAIAASLAHGLIDASYALPDLMLVWVVLINLSIARSPQSPRPA